MLKSCPLAMSFKCCEKCGKEMEKVVGFPGYVWCRDCHITEKVDKEKHEDKKCMESVETTC